jgi:hypothetical protein
MNPEPIDIVARLRMYAEDLHSAGGFNGYATAMSLAADEIVKLREKCIAEYDKGYVRGVDTILAKIKEEQQRCYVNR